MHRIRICTCILIALIVLTLGNGWYLHSLTETMAKPLEQAGISAANGDWDQAAALTAQSRQEWERHQFYFCTTLRQADTDAVDLGFQQLESLLYWQEDAEYSSANATLIANIRLLCSTESLDLKNLL